MPRQRSESSRRRLLAGVVCVVLGCLSGCASRYYYEPSTAVLRVPSDANLDFEATSFESRDGVHLAAWVLPAVGQARATILHFHGKSGNMGDYLAQVDWLPARGFNVVLFDYRGFGESSGEPTPRTVQADAVAALRFAEERVDLNTGNLVVFGQSLGGAIAISGIAEYRPADLRAVITDSTLSSYRRVVQDQMKRMGLWRILRPPMAWLITNNRYSPDTFVDRIAPVPVLFIHGDADERVPPYHCRRLFERAREPKAMWLVEGGHHLDAFTVHGARYRDRLVEYLNGIVDQE